MSTAPRTSRWTAIAAILLFGVGCFLYLFLVTNIADSRGSDAAGRGLGAAYTLALVILLWILLAILLLIGKSSMSSWVTLPAIVLVPLSAVATVVAADIYVSDGGWPILVPVLLPPLIAIYALWARFHPFHQANPAWTDGTVWGAVLIVAAAPLLMSYLDSLPNPAREAQERMRLERQKQDEEDFRRREATRFERLGPHSSLRDYLEYLPPGDERYQQALEGARRVTSRQADAVMLLNDGKIGELQDLRRLDIAVTPDLCQAFGNGLRREAAKIDKSRSDYLIPAMQLERQLPNLKWLVAQRCDLGEALTIVENRIKAVSDSPRLDDLVAALAALHAPR